MKGIVHIRVDDRLIHGQVATRWVRHFEADRIMVIDDEVAANDIEKMMLRSAAPEGCHTSILGTEKAIGNIANGHYDNQRVLVLIKTPRVALEMLEKGLDVRAVNIGNMSNQSHRKQIKRSVSISADEQQVIEKLMAKGVRVSCQMTPDEPDTDIAAYLNNQ